MPQLQPGPQESVQPKTEINLVFGRPTYPRKSMYQSMKGNLKPYPLCIKGANVIFSSQKFTHTCEVICDRRNNKENKLCFTLIKEKKF